MFIRHQWERIKLPYLIVGNKILCKRTQCIRNRDLRGFSSAWVIVNLSNLPSKENLIKLHHKFKLEEALVKRKVTVIMCSVTVGKQYMLVIVFLFSDFTIVICYFLKLFARTLHSYVSRKETCSPEPKRLVTLSGQTTRN